MSGITVLEQDGFLLVDSRLVAARLGIQHDSFLKTIRKYRERIERKFGNFRFQIGTSTNSIGATHEVTFVLLTEPQATVLMTLSRNTDEVVDCKFDLVEAFEKAKTLIKVVIPEQNERLRELELINENLKLQLGLADRTSSMATMHGVPTTLLLLGKGDHVEEVEKPTLEVIDERHNIRFRGQTTKQVAEYLNKKHGTRFKSGADITRILKRLEKDGLISQTLRSVSSEYIAEEHLSEVYKLLTDGSRQTLMGE